MNTSILETNTTTTTTKNTGLQTITIHTGIIDNRPLLSTGIITQQQDYNTISSQRKWISVDYIHLRACLATIDTDQKHTDILESMLPRSTFQIGSSAHAHSNCCQYDSTLEYFCNLLTQYGQHRPPCQARVE